MTAEERARELVVAWQNKCNDGYMVGGHGALCEAVAEAIRSAERSNAKRIWEEAAKICDGHLTNSDNYWRACAAHLAAALRSQALTDKADTK